MDEAPPNVLIVVLDDVGIDQVSAYGFPGAAPTPVIDSLAERGLRFDAAWAMPTCTPTRAALLTGRMPHRNRLGAVLFANKDTGELPLDEVTIPEALGAAPTPYASAAVGKWHLSGPLSPSGARHPQLQGFAWFAGTLNNIRDGQDYALFNRVGFDGNLVDEERFSTVAIVDDAILALNRLPEPWFLYVAFHAAHKPLTVPPAELLRGFPVDPENPRSVYDANVVAADHELARLLDALGPALDRTLVVVVADNGTPRDVSEDDDLRGAKGTLHEGGIRVPLVMAGPPVAARGTTDALVHVVDLYPTLLALAGAPVGGRELDGVALRPVLADPAADVRELLYTEFRHPPTPPWREVHRTVRDEGLKLIDDDGDRSIWRVEGYTERRVEAGDLSDDELERLDRLRDELKRHPRR